MHDIFISYSREDQVYARKLLAEMERRGLSVWMDNRIQEGTIWEREIFRAIDDCSAFVVIMTRASDGSDWVLRECQHADTRRKPTFPLLLSGEVFPRYGPTQFVDVRGGKQPPETFFNRLKDPTAPVSRERTAPAPRAGRGRLVFLAALLVIIAVVAIAYTTGALNKVLPETLGGSPAVTAWENAQSFLTYAAQGNRFSAGQYACGGEQGAVTQEVADKFANLPVRDVTGVTCYQIDNTRVSCTINYMLEGTMFAPPEQFDFAIDNGLVCALTNTTMR